MFLKLEIAVTGIKHTLCLEYFPRKYIFLSFPASWLGNKILSPGSRAGAEQTLKYCVLLCDLQQLDGETRAVDLLFPAVVR